METIKLQSENIITKRPQGMDFQTYKDLLRQQAKHLKNRLKGVVVWETKRLVVENIAGGKVEVLKTINPAYDRSIHGELPKVVIAK